MVHSVDSGSALSKGLAVLVLIVVDRGETPISTLAADLDLSRSTLHRLLAALLKQGLILRVARGRYDIGLGLADAAPGLSLNGQIARAARAPLSRLVADCGLTAHLGVFEGDMVTYLVKASPPTADVAFTRENGQLEAYCSGIGKVLLAHLPLADRQAYLSGGPFVPLTARTIIDPAMLDACLDAAALAGHAVDDEEIAEGLRCLAVPVRDHLGRVVAAISLSASDRETALADDFTLRAALVRCADRIGEALGGGSAAQSPGTDNPVASVAATKRSGRTATTLAP